MIIRRKLFNTYVPEEEDKKYKLKKVSKRKRGNKMPQGKQETWGHIKLVQDLELDENNIDQSEYRDDPLIRAAAIRRRGNKQ